MSGPDGGAPGRPTSDSIAAPPSLTAAPSLTRAERSRQSGLPPPAVDDEDEEDEVQVILALSSELRSIIPARKLFMSVGALET